MSSNISSESPGSRELLYICLCSGFASAVFSMVSPLVPLHLVHLKISPGLIGIIISFSTAGSLFVAVPGGFLINSWGSRLMIQRAGILFTASCVFITIFPDVKGLVIGLFFLEIGKLLFFLGAQSHIGSLGEGRDLNSDFGWYGTAAALGQMAGPAFAGFFIDTAGHRFTWAVISLSIALIILVFPAKLYSGKVNSAKTRSAGSSNKKRGLREFLSVYAFIAILSSFAVLFADGARLTFYPVLLKQFGYSASAIGIYMSLRALTSVSVRFYMAGIVKSAGGRFPALIISLFILAAGIGSTPFCTNNFLLVINSLFVGIGLGLALPLSMATVSEGVKAEDRGVAMGIRLTGNRLAQLINPLFFGVIAQAVNLGAAFISGGFLLLAAVIPILMWWKKDKDSRGFTAR
ncbi:MAG: MFS transporter [Spirochaetia bacterium]|nr:MFS transporter [Spirochaetia bacterium]